MKNPLALIWCLAVLLSSTAWAQTQTVTNSNNGASNVVPVYTGTSTLSGTSPISVSGSNVIIGTGSAAQAFTLNSTSPWLGFGLYNGSAYVAALLNNNSGGAQFDMNSGTTRMIQLDTNGNSYINGGRLGIGISSPTTLFQVFANADSTSYVPISEFDVGNNADGTVYTQIQLGQISGNLMFLDVNNQANAKGTFAILPWGGNVGIGTANPNPSYKLDVENGQINSSVGYCIAGSCIQSWNSWSGSQTFTGTVDVNSPQGLVVGNPSYNYSNYSTDEAIFAGSIALQNMGGSNYVGVEFKEGNQPTSGSMFLGINPSVGGTGGELQFLNGTGQPIMAVENGGAIGIGTTIPGAALEVNGTVLIDTTGTNGLTFSGAPGTQTTPWTGVLCGGDYAEEVDPVGDKKTYEAGDVLVITDGAEGDVQKSAEPYSTMVAGIYATKPGVVGRRESLPKNAEDLPMAMVGIVPTKVTAENGPIRKGDLLVTSSRPGFAMKGTERNRMLGAVIGKAMGSLNSGAGVIEVLVTLQ